MAQLSLKFIDSTLGVAISDINVEIQKIFEGSWKVIAEHNTDEDGQIIIEDVDVAGGDLSGYYEITARIGSYFSEAGYVLPTLKIIDVLPIRLGVSEPDDNKSICIAVTPYGYSFQEI